MSWKDWSGSRPGTWPTIPSACDSTDTTSPRKICAPTFSFRKSWKEEELTELLEKETFKNYVEEHFDANKDLFVELAHGDNFDSSRYPEFDAFYESLNTHLDRNDIRKWIRAEARRKVSDVRGKAVRIPGLDLSKVAINRNKKDYAA